MYELPLKIRIMRKPKVEMFMEDAVSLPFIGTGMKKRKLIIFSRDFSGQLISHPHNTSRSALTTYQPSSFSLWFLAHSLVEDVYEVTESLRHTLFTVCLFVVLHICIVHLVLKKSREAHISPGVVMRLCVTRGIFFFHVLRQSPESSRLVSCWNVLLWKFFSAMQMSLKNFNSISK